MLGSGSCGFHHDAAHFWTIKVHGTNAAAAAGADEDVHFSTGDGYGSIAYDTGHATLHEEDGVCGAHFPIADGCIAVTRITALCKSHPACLRGDLLHGLQIDGSGAPSDPKHDEWTLLYVLHDLFDGANHNGGVYSVPSMGRYNPGSTPPIRLIGAALDTIYLTFGAAPTTSFSAASMFKLVDGYPGCCLRYEFEFKTPSLQPAWVRTDPTGVLIFQQPRFTAEFPADNTMVVRVKAVTPEGKHKTDWVEWKIKLAEAGPAVFNVLAPLSGDAGLVFEVGSAKTKLPAGNGWGGGFLEEQPSW